MGVSNVRDNLLVLLRTLIQHFQITLELLVFLGRNSQLVNVPAVH